MITSIQQASVNSLAAYLTTLFPDCQVLGSWPSPDLPLPAKAITILTAGARQDEDIELRYLDQADVADPNTNARWQVKVCEQPLQIDVWTRSDVERDDICARLDDALNAGESQLPGYQDPCRSGVLLQVGDGYVSTFADFTFEGPDTPDSPESVKRSEYRATIRGTASMALTVTRQSARQLTLILKQRLNGAALFDITTITPAGQTGSTGT